MRLAAERTDAPPRPIATLALAGITTLVSLFVTMSGREGAASVTMGLLPARLSGLVDVPGAVPAFLTPLSAALVHGGFAHLGMNILVLVFAGAQVERVLGKSAMLLAYLFGAYAAAAAQFAVDPSSTTPMIGASGAISSLFGVYALMFGRVKRVTGKFAIDRAIHAAWLLVAWIVLQWMTAALMSTGGMLLATPAHIGGFIAGLILQKPLLLWRYRRA